MFDKGLKRRDGASHRTTMHAALLTASRRALMPGKPLSLDNPRGSDFRRFMTSVSAGDGENPAATDSVEEFLQALPAITHELSEALTAVSAYLTGSRHLLELYGRVELHGRPDRLQDAVEQANRQAMRANDAVGRLHKHFGKLGRP